MPVLSIQKLEDLRSELERLLFFLWEFEDIPAMTVIHRWNFKNHRNILKMSKSLYEWARANRSIFVRDDEQLAIVVDGEDTFSPLHQRSIAVSRYITIREHAPEDPIITEDMEEFTTNLAPTSWTKMFNNSRKQLINLASHVHRMDPRAPDYAQFKRNYVLKVQLIEKCACQCLERIMPLEDNAYPGTLNEYLARSNN
jgi:hypothetical protein